MSKAEAVESEGSDSAAEVVYQCLEWGLRAQSGQPDSSAFETISAEMNRLSTGADTKKILLKRHADVLSVLKGLIESGPDSVVINAAGAIAALSWDAPFRQYVGIKEHNMLSVYVTALKATNNTDAHSKLMLLLQNLAYFPNLKPLMLSDSLGFRDMLLGLMSTSAASVLLITTQLAYSEEGSAWLLSDSAAMQTFRNRVVDLIIGVDSSVDIQAKACCLMAQLVYRPNGSRWLLSSERGLFKAIATLLESNNDACMVSVWQLYANMAHSTENRTLIYYSPDLNILQRAAALFATENDRLKEQVIRLLWGLAVEKDIVRSIVSSGSALLPVLLRMARDEGGKTRYWVCRLLVHLVSYGDDATTEELLVHGAHIVALDLIQLAGFDVSLKEEKKDNYVLHCLSFIMNLANHDVALPVLKACDPNPVHIMLSILKQQASTGAETLKAMFAIAFLIGRDEHTLTVSDIMQSRPDTVQKMVSVLDLTLQGLHGLDYRFGTFSLQLIIHACLAVSVSESNKAALAETPVIGLLKKVLEMFVRNEEPIPAPSDSILSCGGGGSDPLSAALAVETLLQLSFLHEENDELQKSLMPPEMGLRQTVQALVDSDRLPSTDAKRSASFLLSRLLPPSCPSPTALVTSSSSGRRHVMLSYSWHHEARPRLVIAVEKELRRQGCDVWRDETGSSLLPPMHGSTQDCMAQAVELSSIVVVFVSKQYKESPNCRCECKYANQLRGRNKLDIVFVMMQEDYTTASHPNYCDGWLGLIIGDMFYLTLFDEKSVKATSSEILSRAYGVERIGAEPTISSNPKISPAASDEPTFRSHSMPGIFKCSSELDDKSTLQKTDVAAITPGFDRTLLKNDCSLTEETCVHGIDYYTDFTCCGESNIEAAFKLLGITQYAIHSEELQNVMQVLGVYSALDLKYLSRGDIELLSKHLKRSPRSRFIDCLSNS